MSTEPETPGPTKAVAEHEWLKQLVGDWTVESEMWMAPGAEPERGSGREKVRSVGGLWAFGEGRATMHDGHEFEYYSMLGFDVSFKEYRGAWFASESSHLWKYIGEMSADKRVLTLNCEGPDMFRDGETANYRDVIEIVDADHRTLSSYGQDENGNWQQFMKSSYTRVK